MPVHEVVKLWKYVPDPPPVVSAATDPTASSSAMGSARDASSKRRTAEPSLSAAQATVTTALVPRRSG